MLQIHCFLIVYLELNKQGIHRNTIKQTASKLWIPESDAIHSQTDQSSSARIHAYPARLVVGNEVDSEAMPLPGYLSFHGLAQINKA